MRVGVWQALVVAMTVTGCGGDDPDASAKTKNRFVDGTFLVIAHRGGAMVAPPETVGAFQSAWEGRADVLELDLNQTLDGELVVIHDTTVDATTDGTGFVKEMTLADLKKLDAGYDHSLDGEKTFPFRGQGITIPTLAEVVDAVPDAYWLMEIKQLDPPIVDPVVAFLRERKLTERVVVASFFDEVIIDLRDKAPELYTSLATGEMIELAALNAETEVDYEKPGEFADPPKDSNLPPFIEKAHRFGIMVHPWTVNDASEMQTLIDLGVDGIITDDPATLRALVDAR